MQVTWNDHILKVTGNWTGRWLYLAPDYELWIDDQRIDRCGGPRVRPRLEGVFEDKDGKLHHIEANLVSIVGFRPLCEIAVEGAILETNRVRVQNVLNPLLLIIIIISTLIMLYIGPDVLRGYLS